MTWNDDFRDWLTPSKSLENAQKIVDYYYGNSDWSKESLSAMIGNMRHESSVNPNMYEYGYDWNANRGYGLVQWTPRSKFWDWAVSNGLDPEKAESQLARIDYEVENNIQYIPNGHQRRYRSSAKYNFSFADFRKNTHNLSVNQLTEAFMWNYEGPNYAAGRNSLVDRQNFAVRVFNELDWSNETEPDPDPPPKEEMVLPETTPDEPIEPEPDITEFTEELNSVIANMLTSDLYKAGRSNYYQNSYIKLTNQMDNMYKIQPNKKFFEEIANKLKGFNEDYIPETVPDDFEIDPKPDPDPEPNPDPAAEKVFPVKIQNGINFYKRGNWGAGTLQRNMTYGVRSSGASHYGYDIGGGGVKHTIYSVTNGTVTRSNYANGIGNRVTIQNDDDEYYLEYGHLDSSLVKAGDTVTAGQPIAIMGATGGNYAIHLDLKISTTPTGFYAWVTTIDPEKYLAIDRDNSTKLPQP